MAAQQFPLQQALSQREKKILSVFFCILHTLLGGLTALSPIVDSNNLDLHIFANKLGLQKHAPKNKAHFGQNWLCAQVSKKHQKFIFEYWVFSQKSYLHVWCFEKVHICITKIPYPHTASVKARCSLVYNVFHQIGKIRTLGVLGKGYEF